MAVALVTEMLKTGITLTNPGKIIQLKETNWNSQNYLNHKKTQENLSQK